MKAFITASSVISPQSTYGVEGFPDEIREVVSDRLSCIEPDYRNLINPIQLRRMPRILKMGLAASQMCISRAGGVRPEGIIVGTGLGCLDNLEKFLLEVLRNDEHITSVLPFINSTHNAVAAQVAMLLKNHNYNVTYCHRGFSFESALLDALMLIGEKQATNVLVGGIDECTSDYMLLHSYLGKWKDPVSNLLLLAEKTHGTIAGEGSSFFMLSGEANQGEPQVILEGLHTFFTPKLAARDEIEHEIERFLKKSNVKLNELDGILLGLNGDIHHDHNYYALKEDYFSEKTDCFYYKHLCGEYYTSVAFALWLGSVILSGRKIPDLIRLNKGNHNSLKTLLIYNHINNTEHSLILLSYGRF